MQRNRLLQTPVGLEMRLEPFLGRDDWLAAVTAHIILGWIRQQDAFGTVLKNLNEEDMGKARESLLGMNVIYKKYRHFARKYGTAVLPFAWEMLLKQEGEVEEWKLIAMTHMIAEVPHPLSVETLIRFIEDTSNDDLRDAGVSSLVQVTDERVIEKVISARTHHGILKDEFSQVVDEVEERGSGAGEEEEEEDEEEDEDDGN